MGLDTTHDCWHGGYISFAHWREKLAECAGLPPLFLMDGFYPGPVDVLKYVDEPFQFYIDQWRKSLPIKWEILKDDVLYALLNHSDCDGELPHDICGPLADRLEELLPLMPDESAPGHIINWRSKTQTFIDGLRLADSSGEAVEFY